MPPKNITPLDRGRIFYLARGNGKHPLPVDVIQDIKVEPEEIEPEETMCAEDSLAAVKALDSLSISLLIVGETAKKMVEVLRSMVEHIAPIAAEYNKIPPRVRHLTLHAKKRRTRKKNLHRAQKYFTHTL